MARPGAGPGLNLREQPYTVVRCFADNVLLRDTAERRQTADGLTWARVEGPTGATGWASLEYLQPVGPR